MTLDARGWRMALVPDELLNTPAAVEARTVLEDQGFGLLQLPPTDPDLQLGLLLSVIADQVAEYRHRGYLVLAVGLQGLPAAGLHWRSLGALLRRRGVAPLPRFAVNPLDSESLAGLNRFLAEQDVADEEKRIWRR